MRVQHEHASRAQGSETNWGMQPFCQFPVAQCMYSMMTHPGHTGLKNNVGACSQAWRVCIAPSFSNPWRTWNSTSGTSPSSMANRMHTPAEASPRFVVCGYMRPTAEQSLFLNPADSDILRNGDRIICLAQTGA